MLCDEHAFFLHSHYTPITRLTVALVEAYDPQHDRWEVVAPMTQARYAAAAVCV